MEQKTFRGKCHSCIHVQRFLITTTEEKRNRFNEIFSVLHFNQIYRCNVPVETVFYDPEKGFVNHSGEIVPRNFRCPLITLRASFSTPSSLPVNLSLKSE